MEKGDRDRFNRGGEQTDRDRAEQEMAERNAQAREEDYAKRDRVLNRLMSAETPKDVAAALEMIADFENPQYGDSVDRYTYGAYSRTAMEGGRAFEKGSEGELSKDTKKAKEFADQLRTEMAEGLLKAGLSSSFEIDTNGNIIDQGVVKSRVELGVTFELRKAGIISADGIVDGSGNLVIGKARAAGYAIGISRVGNEQRLHYGTEVERRAMRKSFEALHKLLITAQLLQNQTILFDKDRAALEYCVKEFYQYQEYFTNQQHEYFWNQADISKIDPAKPESLDNKEFGKDRNLSYRMYYLLGACETKEKLEDHLNNTKNLEAILTKETVDRILDVAAAQGKLTGVVVDTEEQRHDAAARFLIGPGLQIDRNKRPDHQPVYTIDWMPQAERDPLSVPKPAVRGDDEVEYEYEQKVKDKGAGAVGKEKKDNKRGYLTEFGNPYAKSSRDALYVLMERMSQLTGNPQAVVEAGRYFWTRGMRDQYGLELYTDESNFPKGEELLEYWNTHTDAQRNIDFKDYQRLLTLNGEPVGSDLSKVIHTKWWRFKEMIRDRSAGPYLTWDKFDYTNLSFMRLCRTKVMVPQVDASGKVTMVKQTRSIEEQFLGYRSADGKTDEEPKAMGDMAWDQMKIPEDVKAAVELSGTGATDNADGYFWVMNYLAADDDSEKREYQYVMKGVERPDNLPKTKAWTDKIKFMVITRHDAVAIGGRWREWYADPRFGGDPDKAEFMATREAIRQVSKRKQDWWKGIRSTPEYQQMMSQTIKYKKSNLDNGEMTLVEIIEGYKDHPGLAVKFGFMDAGLIKQKPEHRMVLFD